jgi:hypothetical protein
MSCSVCDHLPYGIEHSDNGAESTVLTLCEATKAVKMSKELIGSVDQMNDHFEIVALVDGDTPSDSQAGA